MADKRVELCKAKAGDPAGCHNCANYIQGPGATRRGICQHGPPSAGGGRTIFTRMNLDDPMENRCYAGWRPRGGGPLMMGDSWKVKKNGAKR